MNLRFVIGFFLSFLFIAGSVYMRCVEFISEPTFVIFVLMGVSVGLFVSVLDRTKSISLKEGKLVLYEMKETESSIKALGRAILRVVEISSSSTIMAESFDSEAHDEAVAKLRELVS